MFINNIQEANKDNPEQHVMGIQHNLLNIKPTSSEINHLWSSYLAENMAVAMLKHMVVKAKDPDFHNVLQLALDVSSQNMKSMETMFNSIQLPIPAFIGENDVDTNTPELFAEAFTVRYTSLMSKHILLNYSIAFSNSSRSDFRNMFSGFIDNSKKVIERAGEVLLDKGLFPKAPYTPLPDEVEYVKNKNYYGSLFGSERPVNVIEISNLFDILSYEMAMRALILGFAQVTQSEKINKYFQRGLSILNKQIEVLSTFLAADGFPSPEYVDFQVTDSTISPYSEKLNLFQVLVTMGYLQANYGLSLTNTIREDIVLEYSRLMAELMEYAKRGTDLLIENGWLLKVPEAADRQKLIRH